MSKVSINGFADEQNVFIQQQHKELLKHARDNNENKEVAFAFRSDLTFIDTFLGTEDVIDFGTALFGQGNNLFVMRNHPRNSSYSDLDILFFASNANIKSLSIVKDNGTVEVITKTEKYNDRKMKSVYKRAMKECVKKGTKEELDKGILYILKKNGGIIEWIR